MCRVLKVHRSGYYAWRMNPLSNRAIEDAALLVEIKQSELRLNFVPSVVRVFVSYFNESHLAYFGLIV